MRRTLAWGEPGGFAVTADIVWVAGKETPVTHLRKIMLEELQRRNYSEITTRKYLQFVTSSLAILASPRINSGRMSCEAIKPTCSRAQS